MSAQERIPLRIGGVMRCCILTLDTIGPTADQTSEGDTLDCSYCSHSLIVRDGAWEWNHPPLALSDLWTGPMTWRAEAKCKGADPNLFHPERNAAAEWERAAKAICAECPVISDCLDYAIEAGEDRGVWGGMGANQRRKIRKARGIANRRRPNDFLRRSDRDEVAS